MQKTSRNRIIRLVAAAATVFMVLATVVLCVKVIAFDRNFYIDTYHKYDIMSDVGTTDRSLMQATDILLDYLQDERYDLELKIDYEGGTIDYYNATDRMHMADVKVLYENASAFMWYSYATGGIAIALICLFGDTTLRRGIARACRNAMLATLAAFAVLGVWIVLDFNSFWVVFHQVMFTNDLWIIDPATSLLIRMFPAELFFDLVARILVAFLGIVAGAIVITSFIGRKKRKNENTGN